MDRAPVIDDGYTAKAYIAPFAGFPALRFDYRPTSRHQLNQFFDKTHGKTNEQAGVIEAEVVANKIVNWNLADEKGKEWPRTKENLLKMWTPFYNRIVGIVLNGAVSDPDPEAVVEQRAEQILEGVGGLEGDRKNSSPA